MGSGQRKRDRATEQSKYARRETIVGSPSTDKAKREKALSAGRPFACVRVCVCV